MDNTQNHSPQDDFLDIPEHFLWQINALAYVSGKTRQQALVAALSTAFPHPSEDPANILEMAHGMMMPGDDLQSLADRFREVRTAEEIPLRDDEVDVCLEMHSGIVDPGTALLLKQAGQIIATGEVIDKPEPEQPEPIRDGDEWKIT